MIGAPQHILSVSELTVMLRDRLEQAFPQVWVEGEVSNVRAPGSGHLYMTLKDHVSQIRVVLFKTSAQRLRFALREGLHVIVRGRLTVYEQRGEYQLVLDYVEPKGIGALQIAFEQLKEKLSREGLFDPGRKRPLPLLPSRVGLVTSPTGAAIRDMLAVIRRRCPIANILIYPVAVQGDGAAEQIAHAVRSLSESGEVDVIIVGRGGGSWEDLWCFNEEAVVRAIAASTIPVVSAVGHEIDYTLADFAADVRAATPSAAAEAVVPVLRDLLRTVQALWARQERGMRERLAFVQRQVSGHSGAMPVFLLRLQRQGQRVDEAMDRIRGGWRSFLAVLRRQVQQSEHDLIVASPRMTIASALVVLPQLLKRTEEAMIRVLASRRQSAQGRMATLDTLSPLAILRRGYSILQSVPDGRIITRARDLHEEDDVSVTLAEGRLICGVRRVLPDSRKA
jgi:exodeoxyribonuclease VII large subunit